MHITQGVVMVHSTIQSTNVALHTYEVRIKASGNVIKDETEFNAHVLHDTQKLLPMHMHMHITRHCDYGLLTPHCPPCTSYINAVLVDVRKIAHI